jgi:hypothetical protein
LEFLSVFVLFCRVEAEKENQAPPTQSELALFRKCAPGFSAWDLFTGGLPELKQVFCPKSKLFL